jgi:hypothetical protein
MSVDLQSPSRSGTIPLPTELCTSPTSSKEKRKRSPHGLHLAAPLAHDTQESLSPNFPMLVLMWNWPPGAIHDHRFLPPSFPLHRPGAAVDEVIVSPIEPAPKGTVNRTFASHGHMPNFSFGAHRLVDHRRQQRGIHMLIPRPHIWN